MVMDEILEFSTRELGNASLETTTTWWPSNWDLNWRNVDLQRRAGDEHAPAMTHLGRLRAP